MKHLWILPVLLIPIILLLTSVLTFSFNQSYYESHYKYNNIQIEKKEDITREVISYLQTGQGDLSAFSQRAQAHLVDVHHIFKQVQILLALLVLITTALTIYCRKHFHKILQFGGIATIGVLILLPVLTLIDFSTAFVQFHLLFFSNELWLLPTSDLLIQLFPQSFFQKTLINIFYLTFIQAVVLIGLRHNHR